MDEITRGSHRTNKGNPMTTQCTPTTTPTTSATTANRFAVAVARTAERTRTDCIRRAQTAKLAEAIAAGPAALYAFAVSEQKKRDAKADATYQNYRLIQYSGELFPCGVEKVGDSLGFYLRDVTSEGVAVFPFVGDQEFCDAINDALRAAGINTFRMETKHSRVFRLLMGERRWAQEGGAN